MLVLQSLAKAKEERNDFAGQCNRLSKQQGVEENLLHERFMHQEESLASLRNDLAQAVQDKEAAAQQASAEQQRLQLLLQEGRQRWQETTQELDVVKQDVRACSADLVWHPPLPISAPLRHHGFVCALNHRIYDWPQQVSAGL